MADARDIVIDPLPEPDARERLGEMFSHAIAMGEPYCERCTSEAFGEERLIDAAAYVTAARIARLIRWIDTHCTPERTVFNGDGTITVASAVVDQVGGVTVVRDVIPATKSAARAVLGY